MPHVVPHNKSVLTPVVIFQVMVCLRKSVFTADFDIEENVTIV